MTLADYADRYETISLTRSESGVLEMTFHTRGGELLWGTTTRSLHAELGHCFADIARDPENKVVLLTGTGTNFCTAMDPEERSPEPGMGAMWARIYEEGVAIMENHLAVPVPMIAAVNGPAHIHAEIAVMCDIVLAAEHADFADVSHAVHGVVPGDGVHTVWPMLLGPNRGRYFLLTGEKIGAREAQRLGVVAEVLSYDMLLPRARVLAEQLAKHSPAFLRHSRRLMVRELRRRVRDELELGLGLEAAALLMR